MYPLSGRACIRVPAPPMNDSRPDRALVFIAITVLIDAIGFGIVMPVLPGLITELTGKSLTEGALDAGWLGFSYAAMQFLFGPIMGALSDRFGRRPIILASLAAFALDYGLTGFAPTLSWLYLGRTIAGITGATAPAANAYIADITAPEQRARNFGIMGGAFSVGFILGPALGGLISGFGIRAPFLVAAALAAINGIYGFFFVRESLPAEKRRPFEWSRANPFGALLSLGRTQPAVLSFSMAMFLFQLASQAFSVWSFYAMDRFNWTPGQVGMSLAVAGTSGAIVQGGLTGPIVKRIGEHRAVLMGMAITIMSYGLFGAAWMGWMVFGAIAFSSLGDLAYPSLNALVSHRVADDAQGELQGVIASLTSLATILGPPIVSHLFAAYAGPEANPRIPGISFYFSAVVMAGVLAVYLWTRNRWPAPEVAAPAA